MPYADPEKRREYARRWIQENYERYKAQRRKAALKQRAKDVEAYNERTRQWRKNNPDKVRAYRSYWKKVNKGLNAAHSRNRYCAIRKRIPVWADIEKINKIYIDCPIGHHVDHIIPIKGINVSGLHVEYNLQYLPATENCRKSNKWEVT